jgi:hypothetical protein
MNEILVRNTGGVVLRVETQCTQRKTYPSATLSTNDLGQNMRLNNEGSTTNYLSHEDSQRKYVTLFSVTLKL